MESSIGEMESIASSSVLSPTSQPSRIKTEYESKSKITGLSKVVTGVYRFRHPLGNLYFVVDSQSATWIIVDAGLSVSARKIIQSAQRAFTTSPAAIILTHGHFDHVGALPA